MRALPRAPKYDVIPSSVRSAIAKDVESALAYVTTDGSRLVVNDELYFTDKGTPVVMNQAGFITGKFQEQLRTDGWGTDYEIDEQEIDGYKEFRVSIAPQLPCSLPKADVPRFLDAWLAADATCDSGAIASRYYGFYVERDLFVAENTIPSVAYGFLRQGTNHDLSIRVGLEFETGNIASSFRALMKLNFLYQRKRIDIGVFITSIDKRNAACRIWPAANRNGSFEELEQRQYASYVTFPLLEWGFEPDSFSRDVPFLRKDKTLYRPQSTGKALRIKGQEYEQFTREGGNPSAVFRKRTA